MAEIKYKAFSMDANRRSTWGSVSIPLKEVSPLYAESARQDGAYWGISINQPAEPIGGGSEEMHLTNQPRIVWAMSGHLENTLQSGETKRSAMGEGVYVQGPALHHSSFINSREAVITLSLTFPGTDMYTFKS